MENKQKERPIFKLKCEVGIVLKENYKYPVYIHCESKTKKFLAFSIDYQFYLLEKNTIIYQFQAEECKCCFSNDEKYIAIIFTTYTTRIMLFDIEKKQQLWVQNCQNFSSLPQINFYRKQLIYMGNRQLFQYQFDGELSCYQIYEKKKVRPYAIDFDGVDQLYAVDYSSNDEIDQYQGKDEFQFSADTVIFQFKQSDDFLLYSKEHYTYSDKTCYFFNPTTLKIYKRFFCKYGHLITKLSESLILSAKLNNYRSKYLFVLRETINNKILRMKRCNGLIISQFKTFVIKLTLYCFNLNGFYKIDFTKGTKQFHNFSYPDFFYDSLTTWCNRNNLLQEPYFYGCINHKEKTKMQTKMSFFKFVV